MMRRGLRWIFRILTLFSLAGLVLCCWLWFRSHRGNDYVFFEVDSASGAVSHAGQFWSSRGQIAISRSRTQYSPSWTPPWREATWKLSHPPELVDDELAKQIARSWNGFKWFHAPPPNNDDGTAVRTMTTMLAAPHWAAASMLSILPAIAACRRLRRARRASGEVAAGPPNALSLRRRIGRMLFTSAAAVSALLMLIILAGWARGAWGNQKVSVTNYFDANFNPHKFSYPAGRWELTFAPDRLRFAHYSPDTPPAPPWLLDHVALSIRQTDPEPLAGRDIESRTSSAINFIGIEAYSIQTQVWGGSYRSGWYEDYPPLLPTSIRLLLISYWIPLLGTAILPAFWLRSWRRRRRRARRAEMGLCARCGYDLRASPERCPECGTVVATASSPIAPQSADSVHPPRI